MKTRTYLVIIFLLIFALSGLIQSLSVEKFNKFSLKIDFHWPESKTHLGNGWHIADVPYRENLTLRDVTSNAGESTFYFNLPFRDAYIAKLYLRFKIKDQPISIYVNDNFIQDYTSKLQTMDVDDFHFKIRKNFSQKGKNTLKIVSHPPKIPIGLEQIKIKNYRIKLTKNIYVVLDYSNVLKEKALLGYRIFTSFIIALLGSLAAGLYINMLKKWLKVSAERFFKWILWILFPSFMMLFVIYLIFYFSHYSLIIIGPVYGFYLLLLILCIVAVSFIAAPREIYLQLNRNKKKLSMLGKDILGLVFLILCIWGVWAIAHLLISIKPQIAHLLISIKPQRLSTLNVAKKENFLEASDIFYYKSGKVMSAFLSSDQQIQGINCAKDSYVFFYESGKIKETTLAYDQEIQGIKCAKGHWISFRANGNILDATLACDQEIQGMNCSKKSRIFFHPPPNSGMVGEATLAYDQEIQGIKCAKGHWISLYPSGKLRSVILSSDQQIKGIMFPKGGRMIFFETGDIPTIIKLLSAQEI